MRKLYSKKSNNPMRFCFLVSFLLLFQYAFNQNYSCADLPDSLLANANVIKRSEKIDVIIRSPASATVQHSVAFTILNSAADKFAASYSFSDNFNKIRNLSAKLYDRYGHLIKTVKKKDFQDQSYDDNYSLVQDVKLKVYTFYYKEYPFTVEFQEEADNVGLYHFPSFVPIESTGMSLQHCNYSIEAPEGYAIRYKLINGAPDPVKISGVGSKKYQWTFNNMPALRYESYQPSLDNIVPFIISGPSDFEYGGYIGKMDTWNNYGKFYCNLYHDRTSLPLSVKDKIASVIRGLSTTKEKVKALYNYLQNNTRYVSIQLGIGGLQPFDATFVAERKYGDCKALSNYMVALLKEASVDANLVVINAGRDNDKAVYEDFPLHYFNHVICCVPDGKDTIWLECTDQKNPFGYLGSFTCDRKALLILENGAKLIHTPSYSIETNCEENIVKVEIGIEGEMRASINFSKRAVLQEKLLAVLQLNSDEKLTDYLNTCYEIPTYRVEGHEIIDTTDSNGIPFVKGDIRIYSNNYVSASSKRLFIKPLFINTISGIPENKTRYHPVSFKNTQSVVDKYVYTIPIGYEVESMPESIEFNNEFIRYSYNCILKGRCIEVIRQCVQKAITLPASDYSRIAGVLNKIAKTETASVVLRKK